MVKRLDEICRQEGLSPARSSLAQLVDIVDGDIRAALNTLQFMQRNFGQISSSSIAMAAVGHKDVGKSNFELWRSIFGVSAQIKAASKHGKAVPLSLRKAELRELELAIESSSNFHQVREILAIVFLSVCASPRSSPPPPRCVGWTGTTPPMHSSYARTPVRCRGTEEEAAADGHHLLAQLLEGCHANCFTATTSWTTHDITMKHTADLTEWLCFASRCHARFVPTAVMAFHHVCRPPAAAGSKPTIITPKAGREARLLTNEHRNVLDSFMAGVAARSPRVRAGLTRTTAAMEVVPSLLAITRPALSGGQLQLLPEPEKRALRALVETMWAFNLSCDSGTPSARIWPVVAAAVGVELLLPPRAAAPACWASGLAPHTRRRCSPIDRAALAQHTSSREIRPEAACPHPRLPQVRDEVRAGRAAARARAAAGYRHTVVRPPAWCATPPVCRRRGTPACLPAACCYAPGARGRCRTLPNSAASLSPSLRVRASCVT